MNINTEDISLISGGVIGGLFNLGALLSKFRVLLSRDSSDAAITSAARETIAELREENRRLHQRVMALDGQIIALQEQVQKLQIIISELTIRGVDNDKANT